MALLIVMKALSYERLFTLDTWWMQNHKVIILLSGDNEIIPKGWLLVTVGGLDNLYKPKVSNYGVPIIDERTRTVTVYVCHGSLDECYEVSCDKLSYLEITRSINLSS